MNFNRKSFGFLLLGLLLNIFSPGSVSARRSVPQRNEVREQINEGNILEKLREAERQAKLNPDLANSISFLASTASNPTVNEVVEQAKKPPTAANRFGPELGSAAGGAVAPCVFDKKNTDHCGSAYREHSGRCSNDISGRRSWGMAGTAYSRILAPKYETSSDDVRTTEFSSRQPLKNAREVSTAVTSTRVVLQENGLSAHIMQFGQFLAHDFTLIVDSNSEASCCPDKLPGVDVNRMSPSGITQISNLIKQRRPSCIHIENFNDEVYGRYHCIRLTRSQDVPTNDCNGSKREQMNAISHVLDASNVYGSSLEESRKLREMRSGRMKVQVVNGDDLLPSEDNGSCATQRNRCPFMAGDGRVNVTPNLISLHTVFLRLHNKIASELKKANSGWDDEKLYQETRRIVSAIQSQIHYYEYLPILLGNTVITKHKLHLYSGYKSHVKPVVLNEMAGAAFRLHTLIDGIFTVISDNRRTSRLNLREQFFKQLVIYREGIEQCIRGLTEDKPWKVDRFFPTQMRDQLFREKQDIVSINIKRGRDHGFASYVDYRKHFGLFVPRNWGHLSQTHPADAIRQLRTVYTSVNDIELYPGGATENPVSGGMVGELFANIIGLGFQILRDGDRFYFESEEDGLIPAQKEAIKGYTYAHLLCDGSDITDVPDKGFFRFEARGVQRVKCSQLRNSSLLKNIRKLWSPKQTPNPPVATTPRPTTPRPTTRRSNRRRPNRRRPNRRRPNRRRPNRRRPNRRRSNPPNYWGHYES